MVELKEFFLDSDNVKLFNSFDEEGVFLFYFLVRLNWVEVIWVLIDCGVDVDICLRDGLILLYVVVR